MSNPILTLGTHLPGKLYISSHPLSSKHSFSASRYLFLQTKDLVDEQRLKDRTREVNVEAIGWVFDLVIRDAVVEGMARRKSKEEKKKEKSEEDVEKKEGLYTKPLDSSSVEDFFAATENPDDIFPTYKSLPGFPLNASIEPQWLEDIPKQEIMVIVHRETKQVFVRKTDGRVYRVQVKTDKQEGSNQVDEKELGKQIGKEDEKEAMAIRKIIGAKRDIGKGWDDCMV